MRPWPWPTVDVCEGEAEARCRRLMLSAFRVSERYDGDGVVTVADISGVGGGVGGDGAGVVADRDLGWGLATAGGVGSVAGVAVDHGHAGVFDVGYVDSIGCEVYGRRYCAEAGG